MQPAPSIEELRRERPDLTDDQLHRRELRFRLLAHCRMMGFRGDIPEPPHDPDAPWPIEAELERWLADGCP